MLTVKNIDTGYILAESFGRKFVVQLPIGVLRIHELKEVSDEGFITAICEMKTGGQYIRYIDLTRIVNTVRMEAGIC